KIGLELALGGGLELARDLAATGQPVFLDMKLLDIPNTVEKAVANAARTGVGFLTVHGLDRKTLAAAVRGRGESGLKLLAVTVMTSIEPGDLAEQGIARSPAELAVHRARLAEEAGLDGVIASAEEASAIRTGARPDFLIVTPGIRPAGSARQDQSRVMTPAEAIRAGADYLVVGRPISEAGDPAAAADAIAADIAAGLKARQRR
ncbi:MAG: orotidine-5'-phosphate decarboxylase, partial [Hyphomicrobiaceae bacterium]